MVRLLYRHGNIRKAEVRYVVPVDGAVLLHKRLDVDATIDSLTRVATEHDMLE